MGTAVIFEDRLQLVSKNVLRPGETIKQNKMKGGHEPALEAECSLEAGRLP